MQHPAITGCTSIFRNIRDNESTILYYTADSDITPGEIKTYLSQELPAYMLPEYFIRLDSFPVNSSGKVDTSRLPEPTAESLAVDDSSIPRTELEQKFHKIWCDILELESVGVNCSFFDAGGNSFKIIKLHRQIESSLGIKIKVVDLFTYPTISGLAEFISPNKEDKAHAVRKTTSSAKCSDIAIIGFSGAFSGSSDIDEYWEKIISGEDCITRLDLESCRNRGISEDIISNPDYIPARGEISQTDKFDPYFFGFSPMDAKFLDPQIRLFVMHCWKALEQSGYIRERNRLSIGLFTGAGANSYLHDNLLRNSDITANYSLWDMMSYGDRKYIASRTAYLLGLKGPVFCLNTACSTSLVSITEACYRLADNRCDLAIAGGCTLHTPESFGYIYSQGTILSPDGRCRAFDKDAAGIVDGSGVGSLVLKRFTDAERDKDNIIAVIKGYSINNDGSRKVGFTAPSVTGQKECIIEAQHMAGITSERIGYIECHGTGTELGDPIELESLKKVFSENSTGITRSDKCYLGSVKANIGHTDTAAGIAGVIKVCRMLQNKLIPPQINYSSPNPKLELESSPFEISKNIIDWKASDNSPLMAGISSFGIGGTNAHIILQEAPQTKKEKPNKAEDIRINLLCMSAKTEKALNNYKKKLLEYLSSKPDLNISDAAYTLRTAREKFDKRKTVAVCGNDFENSIVSSATAHSDKGSNTAFMFPGQGSQYLYMMHDLYKASGVFKDVLDECAEFLIRDGFCDIRKILYPEAGKQKEAEALLNNTLYTQPILFSVELALASLWISLGIKPSIMIGHSLGEYTAACIAGIFSTENALKIIKKRAELISSLEEGNMLAVGINSCCAEKYTESHISLAAVNAPKLCVFAGQKDNINTLYTRFAEDNIFCKKINTSHAFHSFMMDQILDEFREFISNIKLNKPSIPFISNISGNQITGEEAVSPDYWTDHIRKTVNFYKGADKLINEDKYILLEVGPGRTLSTLINMNESAADKTIIQSLPEKDKNSTLMFYSAVGNMWCLGVEADFEKLDNQQDKFIIPLPTYEFDLKSYWIKPDTDKQNNIQNQKRNSTNKWFYAPAWKKKQIVANSHTEKKVKNYLVFTDNTGISEKLLSKLHSKNIFTVKFEKSFTYNNATKLFTVRSGSKEDFLKIFKSLKQYNIILNQIIYLPTLNKYDQDQEKEDQSILYYMTLCFYNLLYILQGITEVFGNININFTAVSSNIFSVLNTEKIIPYKSIISGIIKCIPIEFSEIQCKIIDIDTTNNSIDLNINSILKEFEIPNISSSIIAYRGRSRWFETYEPVELEESPDINNTSFKHGGVYLITGGLSGIGYETAKFLASTYNAVLILTGRTKLPQKDLWNSPDVLTDKHILERIERIKKLEELGAECCIISADISLEKSVKELYEKSITKYKHIDGVIHCAGIPAGQAMFLKQPEDCEPVFAAKVYGTPLLYKYFAGTKPDFFIVCSSMTAITGGYGQSDYAAANSFIDAFANCIKNKNPEENIISINWSLWKETGMGINTLLPNNMQKEQNERLKTAITNSEGIEAFNKIADTKGIPQILVSPFNIESKNNTETDKKENSNIEISDQTDDNFFERPDIDSEYDPPQDHEEKILVRIWENVLGIKGIGINDNFFKLGGHSLNVTQVISRLNKEFNTSCSLTVIFENNTVKELAEYIKLIANMDDETDGIEL